MMKTAQIIRELEGAVRQLGLRVRYESGRFRGGRCLVAGEDMVVLNRRRPVETHLAVLAETLRELPVDSLYLRPAVREALETAWSTRAVHEGVVEEPE
jgi:hypothetical protein